MIATTSDRSRNLAPRDPFANGFAVEKTVVTRLRHTRFSPSGRLDLLAPIPTKYSYEQLTFSPPDVSEIHLLLILS